MQVTPWVSGSGEITLKLSPSVSNIGAVSAERAATGQQEDGGYHCQG